MDRILHYEIARKLGEGKNGTTFLAVDSGLQRAVVVKTLERGVIGEDKCWKNLTVEMERLSALNVAGITRFYSLEQDGDRRFAVREYVEGRTAAELAETYPPSYARWLEIAVDLAGILKAIHDAGLVHRNITASNVIITAKGQVRLTDYGLGLTSCSSDSGAAPFVAPEVLAGSGATPTGDLYSLGVVLFFLLARRMPVRADLKPGDDLFDGIAEAVIPGVARLLLRRLLAAEPKERFGSADELLLTLHGMVTLGAEPPGGSQVRRWSPSPRQYLLLSLLALLLIILWLAITSHPR